MNEYIKMNDALIYNYQKDIIDEKDKEIERLKDVIKNKHLKEIKKLNKELEFEKQIKKEVREYIEENMKDSQLIFGINDINRLYVKIMNDILKILNKVDGRIMKIGDYVRTNDGIGKITKYKYEPEYENCHVIWFDDNNYGIRYADDEIKSSPDVTDLIEVGDIIEKTYKTGFIEKIPINRVEDIENIKIDFKNGFKLSIVTKEQFEDMEYIIN